MVIRISCVSCVLALSLCVTFVHSLGELEKGDDCHVKDKNLPGKCVSIKDCPSAQKEIKQQKHPDICAFEGTIPIVCCVENSTSNEVHRPVGEISKKKCWEYGKLVYHLTEIPSLSVGSGSSYKATYVNESVCHVQPTFVHGGVNAGAKEFPHMALLGYGERKNLKWGCGGSLISEKFVLTAAHCMSERQLGEVRWVRLGDLDISKTTDDASTQDFQVKNRFRHPQYKRPSNYHDIALLEFERPVNFTDYVRPACLHLTYKVAERYLVSGWGHLEHDNKELSNILQKADVEAFTYGECTVKYESLIGLKSLRDGIKDDSQICAGGKKNDKDTCPGDSGGPLQIIHPEVTCMYSIVGVTSFGQARCGVTGIPAIYTRVSNYIKWIEDTVWP